MERKTTSLTTAVLLLLFVVSLPAVVQGMHVSVNWGCKTVTSDPYEDAARSYTCQYITDIFQNQYPVWAANNLYGPSTKAEYVYLCADLCEDESSYDFVATFHVGDAFRKYVYGGYWMIVGWVWTPYGWWPIYEWVVTGPTLHYAYYGWNGASEAVVDRDLYGHPGPKHRFTFIYTCMNGDLIDGDKIGFVDTENGTGIVGMPYAWTGTVNLSHDGYANPWGEDCYIGFENISKWLCDNSFGDGSKNYGDFVRRFYVHAGSHHDEISWALDMASYEVLGVYPFDETWLYNGYDVYVPGDPPMGGNWFSRMRVFGNGDMVLPN
ncbi:MAG: hypothetical protein ACPLRY_03670 [Candidatus Bathyarchaeales archaeon]